MPVGAGVVGAVTAPLKPSPVIPAGAGAEYRPVMARPPILAEPDAIAAAYGGTRRRSTELLRAAGADAVGDRVVPACPAWTIHQLVSHMVGSVDDVLAGNVDGAATDPWTAAQVERSAATSTAALLDHWDEVGPRLEAALPHIPPAPASQIVLDVTTHEHDLRDALGEPGARDSDGITVGFGFLAKSLDRLIRTNGLPTLEITTNGRVLTLGGVPDGEEAQVHLAGPQFELFRSFGGRRTLDQVRALDWSADPSPYLDAFFGGILKPPATPLDE